MHDKISGHSGLFFIFQFINSYKVNSQAKRERHDRIESKNPSSTPTSNKRPKFSVVSSLANKIYSLFKVNIDNPAVKKLTKQIVAFSIAFFVISCFIPFYQFTEGYHAQQDFDYEEFLAQDTDYALDDIMTDDGFLLKPNLNSSEGDRSTASEIFAYEVEPGDTLSSIAQRFGIKKETLIMENNLWNANSLRSGMTLNILPVDGISHLVKSGETVEKIAKKYDVDVDTLIKQNQLEEGETLLAKSTLIIPGAKKSMPVYSAPASSAPSNATAYRYNGPTNGRLIWPTLTTAKLTQGYKRGHYAIDIGNRNRGPIFAAASGKIVRADYGWNGGYGNVLIIDHGDGMQTLYAHNEKLYVSVGQYVEQGQTIAWMGNTGRVYGPTGIHTHFEVRINGVKYNPMNFF